MLRLGTFRFDATPPVGQGTGFGFTDATTGVRDPLYHRGFLLSGGSEEMLLVQCDWTGTMNGAHDELVRAYATGAGLAEDRVVVHCTHQHDAPLVNFELEPLLGVRTFDRGWWARVLEQARRSAGEARERATPVADIGYAETRLWGYASSRDVVDADGRFVGNRWSRTQEEHVRDAPVGTVDPMLRTLAFRGPPPERSLLAALTFYGSHPQVASGSGRYSADAPGEALRLLTDELSGAIGAILMGCAGNVTAGKYTSPTDREGNLVLFGRRLAEGIRRNLAVLQWEPAGDLKLRSASFPFPAEPAMAARLRKEVDDSAVPLSRRHIAAAVLTAMEHEPNGTYRLRCLELGSCRVLLFPGEPFVEYQLFAQSLAADRFVAAVGNCDESHLYLPRAHSFMLGAYEVESFRWCTPQIEPRLEGAIRELLA